MKKNEYKCETCKGVFLKGWTDEEADMEYRQNFEAEYLANVETEIICDDCYKKITNYYSPWSTQ